MAANTLRKKVVQMLKLKRDELAQCSPVTFSKILMKASSLNATYKRIKAVYDSLDINKDGYVTAEYAMHLMSSCRSLDLGELQKMIDKLEIGHEVSPRDLKSVFELCDVDHDGAISLKEFLVTLSLLYLLRAVPTLISIRQDRQDASGLIRHSHSATTVPLFFLETYCT